MTIAISACLLGEPSRYDGSTSVCEPVAQMLGRWDVDYVTVCPEVAGGLPIPRPACEIVAGVRPTYVTNTLQEDRTAAFEAGALATLESLKAHECTLAVLKARSPSCGSGQIYDGTFGHVKVPGYGVAAALLRNEGIRVVDEELLVRCAQATERRHGDVRPAILAENAGQCPTLETERLVMRPLVESDAPDVFAYCKDPAVGDAAGWPAHRTVDDSLDYILGFGQFPHVYGLFVKEWNGAQGDDSAQGDGDDQGDGSTQGDGSNGGNGGAWHLSPCIGSLGLVGDPHRVNPDCMMLGYSLAPQAWNRGYMTEASKELVRYGFEELGLSLITSNCFADNLRSARVLEKCGFEPEGLLHGALMHPDGSARDVVMYSLRP